MKNIPITLIAVILYSVSVIGQTAKTSHYKIAQKIKVEGDYSWDCIRSDDESGRLFVSHSVMVQVVDQKDGKLLGTISNLKGARYSAYALTYTGFAAFAKLRYNK